MALADTFTQSAVGFLNKSVDMVQFVGGSTDITERKLAEEEIRQSDRELRQLLDLTPLHLAECGPRGSRPYANQAALAVGWPAFHRCYQDCPTETSKLWSRSLYGRRGPQFKSDRQAFPFHTS